MEGQKNRPDRGRCIVGRIRIIRSLEVASVSRNLTGDDGPIHYGV